MPGNELSLRKYKGSQVIERNIVDCKEFGEAMEKIEGEIAKYKKDGYCEKGEDSPKMLVKR